MMTETCLWNFSVSREALHYCIFLLYQLRIKPIQYYLCKCFHKRGRCWDTQRSLVVFSGQSVGPEMMCEHMLNMLNQCLFGFSELQMSMQKYPVFSWDGMRTNVKIFLSQIEFLFSYQLITCIRCLVSLLSEKQIRIRQMSGMSQMV